MKAFGLHIKTVLLISSFFFLKFSSAQGRVVINEYMPWTLNGCGATSEFVELLNFGPGPMNIGCYILTDGDYTVTIPPNTILLPGEFYVIAGQNIINAPCANIDSTIHADLNWNTCGCTNAPIPTTGDGFFTDGGSANEQVVLLDPNLHIVDAVVRNLPAEPSSLITTSGIGGCAASTFNLDLIPVNYEVLGMSTGRGNSFARKLDGDCGWVKDPQQSANASNNTPGDQADVYYQFSYVEALDCSGNHGSIQIFVKRNTYDDIFPMHYTLAFDANNNGTFDLTDTYTYGTDSTPPDILISNLPVGHYRITVESSMGCDLESFDFTILPCQPVLAVNLVYFRKAGFVNNQNKLEWLLNQSENVKKIVVEAGSYSFRFNTVTTFESDQWSGSKYFSLYQPLSSYRFYRLKMFTEDGNWFYSPVVDMKNGQKTDANLWPNPAKEEIHLQLNSDVTARTSYSIFNTNGTLVKAGSLDLKKGANSIEISVQNLPAGVYLLRSNGAQPISFRFVKH